MSDQFDYIIVGAGSAGCVLANRLSADPKVRVCLLDAGPADWNPLIHMPVGWMQLMKSPTYNWLYETESSDWTGGRRVPILRGKTLELVRELYPKAHFATVYAKPKGRPMVDTFITEVSQDTWIFFPWDMALQYVEPYRGKE